MCLGWPDSQRKQGKRGEKGKGEKTLAHLPIPFTNWAAKLLKKNFLKNRQESEDSNKISGSLKAEGSSRAKQKVSSDLVNVIRHKVNSLSQDFSRLSQALCEVLYMQYLFPPQKSPQKERLARTFYD